MSGFYLVCAWRVDFTFSSSASATGDENTGRPIEESSGGCYWDRNNNGEGMRKWKCTWVAQTEWIKFET